MATTTIRNVDISVPAAAPKKPAAAAANNAAKGKSSSGTKRTFMLHSLADMSALGRFVSTDWRYAALKAASRGHTGILLRQTGTREVREFEGSCVPIEAKEITRGGRTITYRHRPVVKFTRKFTYKGAIDDTTAVQNNPKAAAANPNAAPAA